MHQISDISVIIPSYNRPQLTLRAVSSALSQTLPPLEVIVVDDGSRSAVSEQDLQSLATDFPSPVRLLSHSRNAGAAAARNTGVNNAKGPFVAFLDSDDFWLPQKLATQRELAHPDDSMLAICCGWGEIRNEKLVPEIRLPRDSKNADDFLAACWHCPGSTLLLPKAAFDETGPFNVELPRLEDYEWFVRFSMSGGRLISAPIEGSRIAIGTRYGVKEVKRACQSIISRHAGQLSNKQRQTMRAYLYQQLASAHYAHGEKWLFAWMILRSLQQKPRATFHLDKWWNYARRSH
ncbi:MAG: glycosyltransferase family A protein [Pseudomonadota bacterium]